MKIDSQEEFELQVHQCFGKIFELLSKIDKVAAEKADEEEEKGNYGPMSDLRDWVEDVMLYCHLAWQYHRLAKGPSRLNVWDNVSKVPEEE